MGKSGGCSDILREHGLILLQLQVLLTSLRSEWHTRALSWCIRCIEGRLALEVVLSLDLLVPRSRPWAF